MQQVNRFELSRDDGVVRHYPTKEEAMRAAIPGDSLFDREARPGGIELWMVGGDLDRKILMTIRRKRAA